MELLSHGDEVVLQIGDNGRGLERTERQAAAGLGLAGMETRARGCGGTLKMETAAGKGLKLEVTCPAAR